MKIDTQIIIGKCNHKGNEQDCYIPQINLGSGWKDILTEGSYVLKESYDPVVLCKKCDGHGCQQCQNRGFLKGERSDLKYIAQILLNKEVQVIENSSKVMNKYNT